jgi:asparagine synthase (glutamine-hydrolysing)
MVSDAPLGALLSGGLDSSTVVALMQRASTTPVRTYTIGFREPGFDEAGHARAVARHLGTDHTEMVVTARECLEVIPSMPDVYDEPFADSSQIPTFVVSKLARRGVTVALSGDGGDELLGGYNRYAWTRRIWNAIRWCPLPVRRATAGALRGVRVNQWNGLFEIAGSSGKWAGGSTPGDRAARLAGIVECADPDGVYHRLVTSWEDEDEVLNAPRRHSADPVQEIQERLEVEHLIDRMMVLDQRTYLPEDILVKVDRASMAFGLEVRSPLLDHRLVEFAWSLPRHFKLRKGVTKWILRVVLYRHVPREIVDRPKAGFGVPLAEWLRGTLRGWAEDLLSEERLRREGLFQPGTVLRYWREHRSRSRNWATRLWTLLMFQAWRETWAAS